MKNKKANDDSVICFWNDNYVRRKLLVAAATDCDIIDTFALLLSLIDEIKKKASHSRKKKGRKNIYNAWIGMIAEDELNTSVKYSLIIIYLLFYAHLLCAC